MNDDESRSPDGQASVPPGPPDLVARLKETVRSALGLRPNASARTEIEEVIAADEAAAATLTVDERAMLRAILRLGDMRVEDVMVPRADIEAIDIDSSLAEVVATFRESAHSRMPVYRETLDDPVGMLHIRDLLAWMADRALSAGAAAGRPSFDFATVDLSGSLQDSKLVRPLLFVPASMPARALLKRMQTSRTQMALVIDEYGGTDGLVSLEDLVEIIVGEIEDEHDLEEEPAVLMVGEGLYVADARADLEQAAAIIGPEFRVGDKAEEIETVGGLVFAATGRIPPKGEVVEAVAGFEFEVLDADPRRIKRVRIRDLSKAVSAPPGRKRRVAAG
jgi:CBS domain containing-hemolysin-like protein